MAWGVVIALVSGMENKIAKLSEAGKSRVRALDICWLEESRWEVLITRIVRKANSPGLPALRKTLALIFFAMVFAQLQVFALPSMNLTWNPSSDPSVAGYNIYYGGVNGVYTNEISVGNVTIATVTGLTAGATYYFAATAYDASGSESPFSNQATYTVPGPAILSLNTMMTNGIVTAVSVTATGTIPNQWALQSSPDLKNWTTIAIGTNSPVNVLAATGGAPAQFFRLESE